MRSFVLGENTRDLAASRLQGWRRVVWQELANILRQCFDIRFTSGFVPAEFWIGCFFLHRLSLQKINPCFDVSAWDENAYSFFGLARRYSHFLQETIHFLMLFIHRMIICVYHYDQSNCFLPRVFSICPHFSGIFPADKTFPRAFFWERDDAYARRQNAAFNQIGADKNSLLQILTKNGDLRVSIHCQPSASQWIRKP